MSKTSPPDILARRVIASTRIFTVEELELRFANGREVKFERLVGPTRGAVLVVPLLNDDTLLLIREYRAGIEGYHLSFPMGLIEREESVLEAANREMQEEIGHAARHLERVTTFSNSPNYQSHRTHVVMARGLYPQTLAGDEPEPPQVVHWPLTEIDALLERDDFSEARSIAALFLVQQRMDRS